MTTEYSSLGRATQIGGVEGRKPRRTTRPPFREPSVHRLKEDSL